MSTLADLAADQWLYALYSADATLTTLIAGRVYQDIVPQDNAGNPQPALFPCIVIRPYVLADTATQNANIFLIRNEYIITAIGRTAYLRDLEPIAVRIQALTHKASVTVTSRGLIYTAHRLRLHRAAYSEAGVAYRELGIVARVYSQAG